MERIAIDGASKTRIQGSRPRSQRLDDGVVYERANLLNGLRTAVGPGAIGEQGNAKLTVGIDPERCAGVTEVAEGARGEVEAGGRGMRGGVPSESAGSARRRILAAGEEGDGFGFQQVLAAAEKDFGEASDIRRRSEEAGVSGNAAHDVCVLIVDLALDDAMAKGTVVFGGGDGVDPTGQWGEAGVGHAARFEDFALRKASQRFAGEALQDFAQEDEANVAVAGSRSRRCDQGSGACGTDQIVTGAGGLEELDVGRKTAGVSEQHANGDGAAVAAMAEFGEERGDRRFQIQQAALVEQHSHGCGRDNFCDRGEVKDRLPAYLVRIWLVGVAAETCTDDARPAAVDRQGGAGKGMLADAIADNGEGASELGFLLVEFGLQGVIRF